MWNKVNNILKSYKIPKKIQNRIIKILTENTTNEQKIDLLRKIFKILNRINKFRKK
jgi:hypothetical protein